MLKNGKTTRTAVSDKKYGAYAMHKLLFLFFFLFDTENCSEKSRKKFRAFYYNHFHMYPSFVYIIIFTGGFFVTL